MIIVGMKLKWRCCTGASDIHCWCFECVDYHEAAIEILKSQHGNSWQSYQFLDAEFHDTQTKKTWHVDSGEHTKRDYKYESDESFKKRWELNNHICTNCKYMAARNWKRICIFGDKIVNADDTCEYFEKRTVTT